MQYPIIDLITSAYINNGWTGLDIPQTITYEPIQLGSGDPKPYNIRPIFPATTLNIGGNDVSVYGGTLDVTTGILTVDRAEVDLGSLAWIKITTSSTGKQYFQVQDELQGIKPATGTSIIQNILCSRYTSETWQNTLDRSGYAYSIAQGWMGRGYIVIYDPSFTDVETFSAAMNGVQLVYELATPITYQLSPAELATAIGIENDIAHRLKLPLPHYFPHPVIDALQRAAAGTQTADDTEILKHYLTHLGIGGI